jgi:steroid delta-isomerase-like uncharacterized protein
MTVPSSNPTDPSTPAQYPGAIAHDNTLLAYRLANATGNLEAVAEVLADDVEFIRGGRTRVRGKSAVLEYLAGIYKAFPDLTTEVKRVVAQGDTVALESVVTGTHRGMLEVTPDGRGFPPTGQRISVPTAVFLTCRGGQIVRWQMYNETAIMRRSGGSQDHDRSEVIS